MATFSVLHAGVLIGTLIYLISHRSVRNKRLPGPRPLPLLGNARGFPPAGTPEFQHWLEHKDLYGGVSSVSVLGTTLVIVHDKTVAHELLDKLASKSSGRPSMTFANKLCGYESIVLCQGHTTRFRRYRKLLHQELGTKVSAAQYQDAQEIEVRRQLVRGLNQPEKWLEQFKTTTAATVLNMTYGYTIEPHKPDPLVSLIDSMMEEFSLAAVPMAWAVDIVPALRFLPNGFPATKFKATARKWRRSIYASAYIPYRFVRRQMTAENNRPSYVSKLISQLQLQEDELSKEDEDAVVWTTASLYGAAADTTVITLKAFTLAMLLFPHVQLQAQEEIDRVVGHERLPSFSDREKLPYVKALVKEALRWWPIAPMGFPHTATDAIEYAGLHIPKGTFILPAVWWFLHDPAVYFNPEAFDPSRFLPPRSEPDPATEAFGYGRRICPGRFFADSALFLNIAMSLAAFNIIKARDADGRDIEVDVKPRPGILTYPTAFDCVVEPRSDKYVELIRRWEREHPLDDSDARFLDSVEDFDL